MDFKVRDILGSVFLIQSSKKDCTHIQQSLDSHLNSMRKKAQELTDEEFQTILDAVATKTGEKDKNL